MPARLKIIPTPVPLIPSGKHLTKKVYYPSWATIAYLPFPTHWSGCRIYIREANFHRQKGARALYLATFPPFIAIHRQVRPAKQSNANPLNHLTPKMTWYIRWRDSKHIPTIKQPRSHGVKNEESKREEPLDSLVQVSYVSLCISISAFYVSTCHCGRPSSVCWTLAGVIGILLSASNGASKRDRF